MSNMTKDQAVDAMMYKDHTTLYEKCLFAHKDLYDYHGWHLARYTRAELVSWWLYHYDWDMSTQSWVERVPLQEAV